MEASDHVQLADGTWKAIYWEMLPMGYHHGFIIFGEGDYERWRSPKRAPKERPVPKREYASLEEFV